MASGKADMILVQRKSMQIKFYNLKFNVSQKIKFLLAWLGKLDLLASGLQVPSSSKLKLGEVTTLLKKKMEKDGSYS